LGRCPVMELLLNLAWLLLLVPAYWLWRRGGATRACGSLPCLLTLACVLVILFPVVSATDDLLAMRTEMEESPISKRSLHEARGARSGSREDSTQPRWWHRSIWLQRMAKTDSPCGARRCVCQPRPLPLPRAAPLPKTSQCSRQFAGKL